MLNNMDRDNLDICAAQYYSVSSMGKPFLGGNVVG